MQKIRIFCLETEITFPNSPKRRVEKKENRMRKAISDGEADDWQETLF